jgi:hypothetical protein
VETWQFIVLIAVLLLIALGGFTLWYLNRRRSTQLQERFGPEYERTVREEGKRSDAEKVLAQRKERVEKLDIQPLTPRERDRFADDWNRTQARFVDDPPAAVGDADALIQDVMRIRGYPVSDFEQRAGDISVDHPDVVSNYREAHAIHLANEAGNATTEDLRRAFVHYRELFAELLEADDRAPRGDREAADRDRDRDRPSRRAERRR